MSPGKEIDGLNFLQGLDIAAVGRYQDQRRLRRF